MRRPTSYIPPSKRSKKARQAGFSRGRRPAGDTRETSGNVRTIYSRDPNQIDLNTCITCRREYRGDACPRCHRS